jgi:hypothetical protein
MSTGENPTVPASGTPSEAPNSTAVQTANPEPGSIPLPPPTPRPRDTRSLAIHLGTLDFVLVILSVAFAFLIALFPIANSDFWMHLASGRLLSEGKYTFGVDPFSYTTEGVYWANHNWLFDLVVYWLYTLSPGGDLLVIVKAALVGLLAAVMLATAYRPGGRMGLPVACVLLAILAMSPRATFQPILVSVVLLGITVWLLERRWIWLIPVVCCLWVNLDVWFILGPITVALYLLASFLPQEEGAEKLVRTELTPNQLGIVLGVSLLACLVNPHTYHVFVVPSILPIGPTAEALLQPTSPLNSAFLGPLDAKYYVPRLGLSVAGLAFIPLALAGATSFALTFGRWKWSRLTVFLGFLILGLVSARCIPFFAVVAGPITALNFADFAAAAIGTDLAIRRVRVPSFAGRYALLVTVILLLVAAIPGWLQNFPHSARQVGLGIREDVGLRETALQINSWREKGLIEPGQHWFNLMPEAACYLAWFAPGEKTFFDYRFELFGDVVRDYRRVYSELAGEDSSRPLIISEEDTHSWDEVFANPRTATRFLLVSSDPSNNSLLALVTNRVALSAREWTPCYMRYSSGIYGWNGASNAAFGQLASHPNQLAFGDHPEPIPKPPAEPVNVAESWYEELYRPGPTTPRDLGEAWQYLARFEAEEALHQMKERQRTLSLMGASVGGLLLTAHGQGTPPGWGTMLTLQLIPQAIKETDDSQMAALCYLAIRAARRGLAENPKNAQALWLLGQAYLMLGKTRVGASVERGECGLSAQMIRHCQMAAALEGVLKLEPSLQRSLDCHLQLKERVYTPLRPRVHQQEARGNWDPFAQARMRHEGEFLKLCRENHYYPRVPPEHVEEALKAHEADYQRRKDVMDKEISRFDVWATQSSVGVRSPVEKAEYAMAMGLCDTALKVLKDADVKDLKDPRNPALATGATLLFTLSLQLGEPEQVRENMTPDSKPIYGVDARLRILAYHWLQIQLGAVIGDYPRAGEMIDEALQTGAQPFLLVNGLRVGKLFLDLAPSAGGLPGVLRTSIIYDGRAHRLRPAVETNLLQSWSAAVELFNQEVELRSLRAWLALEAGDTATARDQATQATRHNRFSSTPAQGLARNVLFLLSLADVKPKAAP